MSDIFELASRMKLRFVSEKGVLSAEDFWDLGEKVFESVYASLCEQKEKRGQKSLFKKEEKGFDVLQLKLDILEYIAEKREEEEKERESLIEKRKERQEILDVVAELEKQELYKTPIEKLKKRAQKLAK